MSKRTSLLVIGFLVGCGGCSCDSESLAGGSSVAGAAGAAAGAAGASSGGMAHRGGSDENAGAKQSAGAAGVAVANIPSGDGGSAGGDAGNAGASGNSPSIPEGGAGGINVPVDGGAGAGGVDDDSAGGTGGTTATGGLSNAAGAGTGSATGGDLGTGTGGSATGGAGTGGAGTGGTGTGGCAIADDCEQIVTLPADCAEAECFEGACSYHSRDADGDGYRADRCVAQTPGIVVTPGTDCRDDDPSVNTDAWDGPEGEGHENGCNDEVDQDCSGLVDDQQLENGATCVCEPGTSQACNTSESGVEIVYPVLDEDGAPLGRCRRGARECLPNGTWGSCTGAVDAAQETCDGEDNDCDGIPSVDDPDVVDEATFVCDVDLDNHAPVDGAVVVIACSEPAEGCEGGHWLRNPDSDIFDDCDDLDPQVNPDETESCDGKDDDCDTFTDEAGAIGETYWSYDGDGDGYRAQLLPTYFQCSPPAEAPEGCAGACSADAWLSRATAPLSTDDCEDADPQINPGATDLCNGVDQNCDEAADTGCDCTAGDTQICGADAALDGVGICKAGEQTCNGGTFTGCIGSVNREAEVCGTVDRDCDGLIGNDDNTSSDKRHWVCDADGDGSLAVSGHAEAYACLTPDASACNAGAGDWVEVSGTGGFEDCNDSDSAVHPRHNELCDGVDNDCDGLTDAADTLADTPDVAGTTFACVAGEWVITECPDDAMHCDDSVSNGCETDATALDSCRTCETSCHFACGSSGCVEVGALRGGNGHSCAIDTLARAACWGRNDHGELGNDSNAESDEPATVLEITNVSQIAAGNFHSCAVAAPGGAAYCWGDDTYGQLGNGGNAASGTPSLTNLTGVTSIAAGFQHSCAVVGSEGGVWCWGNLEHGMLGTGDGCGAPPCSATSPRQVMDASYSYVEGAAEVVAGRQHSCARLSSGEALCWGDNQYGQLGAESAESESAVAVPVADLTDISQISAGYWHTCALSDGSVYCWGNNSSHEVGQESGSEFGVPMQVSGLSAVTEIAAGSAFTCALSGGQVSCWGANNYGQRGDEGAAATDVRTTIEDREAPGQPLSGVVALTAGAAHACALTDSGQTYCWGRNTTGQLGNGTASGEDPNPIPSALSPLTE